MTYGIDRVSFIDENMCSNKKWFMEFLDKLEESGLATLIKWGMVCHTRTVDAQLLQKAHDCGLAYVSYGGETSNERLLKQIGKGQNKEQMSAAIQATQAAGINAIMSFIIGFPDQNVDDIMEDLQFFIDNQIHTIPFFLQPYCGSKLFSVYKDKLIEQGMTADETEFLVNPTLDLYYKVFGKETVVPSLVSIAKNLPLMTDKIKDAVLERWILSLDDATRLSVNLTKFNDVELT